MRTTLTIIGILTASQIYAQKLDVEGDTKIQPNNDNTKDSVLVTDGNGVIYYRDLSTIVTPGTTLGEMQYWNGSAWVPVAPGSAGQILRFINGVPTWTPEVCLTDFLNPATGKVWMDRNLGATQVAPSSTDFLAYGDLYQWGRGSDGHQTIAWTFSTTSNGAEQANETSTLSNLDQPGHDDFITTNSTPFDWRSPQNDNLWQGASGVNNPCPSGYRLPTEAEWEAERMSWSTNNAAGAFASPLKLPMAGLRDGSDGSLILVGTVGFYWSSTVSGSIARRLYFNSSSAGMFTSNRADGLSVRCIKD